MKPEDYKMLFCLLDLNLISPRLAFEAICLAIETKRDIRAILTEGEPTTDRQRYLADVVADLRSCLADEPDRWPRPTILLADPKGLRA